MIARAEVKSDFAAFTANHLFDLVRLARTLMGDPDAADDLTQHSLEKAYRAWPKVMRANNRMAYVRRIMVNSAYDSWRRKRRFRELVGVPSAPEVDIPSPGDWGSPERTHDSAARLAELLSPLTAKERAVITLRFLLDLSESDTAYELGIAVGTVKSTSARALKKMRQAETSPIGA